MYHIDHANCNGLDLSKDHYYTNDFARHCPNINRGGHKIQMPRKMPEDLRRRTFLLTDNLAKCIYGGVKKMSAFINRFMEAVKNVRLEKSIYGGGRKCLPR
jgi:hypothetical protein